MKPQEIVKLRKKLGVSQERFAHMVGATAVTVNRWENGKSNPSRIYVREMNNLKGAYGD